LLAVFKLVLLMIVPRDLPVHYYALYAIQKVQSINQSKHISIAPYVASESEAHIVTTLVSL